MTHFFDTYDKGLSMNYEIADMGGGGLPKRLQY